VKNVIQNVLLVKTVINVYLVKLPDNKLFQTVHVPKNMLKSITNVYLVIIIVTIVKTLKDIVLNVSDLELKLQPVSVQKVLMKSKELQNVHSVILSVKNVLKVQLTV
jgi:hypothetical protein